MQGSRSVLAAIALIVALVAIAISVSTFSAPARVSTVPPPTPQRIDLSLLITAEGSIGGPALSHLYDPQLFVVRRGDTVHLRVMNQSFYRHGIEVIGYGVRTGELAGGASEELTFVANQAGVFEYQCYLPYDPATATCAPDHAQMKGHLIVIDAGPR